MQIDDWGWFEWITPDPSMEKAMARIRELERQLEAADGHAKRIESVLERVTCWDGQPATHVVVPVEPTGAMLKAGWDVRCDSKTAGMENIYRAMVRAAQENADETE